jgi:hypothetical protein
MMGELLLQGGGVQLLVAFAGGSGKLEEQQPEEEEELCTTNSSSSSHWYFTKDQIDNNSPSRRDGIDLKKENYLRKSYCTFLQDLGMRLKEPQLTIATAIVFCHRFFLRQSHHKNDCHLIATSLQPIILSGNPSSSGFHWNFSQLVVESIDFCGE